MVCDDNRLRRATCPDSAPVEFIEHSYQQGRGAFDNRCVQIRLGTPTAEGSGLYTF